MEDRLVKQAFKEAAEQGYEAQIQLLTKKPVTAQSDEIVLNPRARSAKLRAVVKIKNRIQSILHNQWNSSNKRIIPIMKRWLKISQISKIQW